MAAQNTHSFNFVPSGSYLYIPHADQTGLSITGNMTIAFWVRNLPFATGLTFTICGKKILSSGNGYLVYSTWPGLGNPARIHCRITGTGGTHTTSVNLTNYYTYLNNVIDLNDEGIESGWVHVAIVVNFSSGTSNIKTYANGYLLGNSNGSVTAIGENELPFTIGADANGDNSVGGSCYLDEVRVWDAALTEEMITEVMRENFTQTALQGYWSFNEHLFDSSQNDNTLTVSDGGGISYRTETAFRAYGRTSHYTTVSGDGYVLNSGGSTTWIAIRGASSGSVVSHTLSYGYLQTSYAASPPDTYAVGRVFLSFDTSEHIGENTLVPEGIYDVVLTIAGDNSSQSTSDDNNVYIVGTSPNSSTSLELADYSRVGGIKRSEEITVPSYGSSPTVSVWPLNEDGKETLDLEGITYLGLRTKKDLEDIVPTGRILRSFIMSEYATGTTKTLNRPRLWITDSLTPMDILSDGTEPVEDSGGVDRDPGGQGTPGYVPGGSGSANGGSSAGETALFFFAWLDT